MEPTKLQKNFGSIQDIQDIRAKLHDLTDRIKARYNSDSTERAVNLMRYADSELLDRLVELGVTIKYEDGSPNAA